MLGRLDIFVVDQRVGSHAGERRPIDFDEVVTRGTELDDDIIIGGLGVNISSIPSDKLVSIRIINSFNPRMSHRPVAGGCSLYPDLILNTRLEVALDPIPVGQVLNLPSDSNALGMIPVEVALAA